MNGLGGEVHSSISIDHMEPADGSDEPWRDITQCGCGGFGGLMGGSHYKQGEFRVVNNGQRRDVWDSPSPLIY